MGPVAKLVKDHEIQAGEAFGKLSGLAFCLRLLKRVEEIEGRPEQT